MLPQAAVALAELGSMADLEPVIVTEVASIPTERLETGAVLALFTIGETRWSDYQRQAIEVGVQSGKTDVLAVHSATDSCLGWDYYGRIVGARFDGHPWTTEFGVEVTDADHPATRVLPGNWSWRDEVYLFRDLPRRRPGSAPGRSRTTRHGGRRSADSAVWAPSRMVPPRGRGADLFYLPGPLPIRLGKPALFGLRRRWPRMDPRQACDLGVA